MIRWLHLSDLHFNGADDMSTILLRDQLPLFLKKNSICCDYVFCTGDIREGKTGCFPDEAADYLKNLCTAVGTDTSRLFIVPGNHDIDRASSGRDAAIERVMFQRNGYYDAAYGQIEESDLRAIHGGQKDFRAFLEKMYDSDRMAFYNNPLQLHFNIETSDFNILHVDTTITQRSGQETADLIVGTKALLDACKTLNPDKPTILLTHFPFTSLLQDEKKYVEEMLYRFGVQLWLAGHEHDHNLQPVKYLYSVQAGELKMENKTHATVLMGNYEPTTSYGYISAYTWFLEGWAEYPIIWHDYSEENKFPFALQLPKDNGLSREAVLIQQANRNYLDRLPENVLENIVPDIEFNDERHTDGLPTLIKSVWNTDTPHIILLADGGMGKSTMMMKACEKYENAMYIPLEGLVTIGYGIEEYIVQTLFDGNIERLRNFARNKYAGQSLILLIDGLNEIDGASEQKFINELKRLNMLKGIQIIVSSRSDFTPRYSMPGYQLARLLPLRDEQISSVFAPEDWKEIQERPTLHHLLSNPMMVTMYKAISPVIEENKGVEFLKWREPIRNATDLLHNYFVAQIALLSNREGVTGEAVIKAARCITDVLPFVAYQLESNYRFNIENKELRELVNTAIGKTSFDDETLEAIAEHFRTGDVNLSAREVLDILNNELHLLHQIGGYTALPHQIYRDYLSAFWIANETERAADLDSIWNERGIPRSVMTHIQQMSGRYWKGIAQRLHQAGKNRRDAFNLVGNLLDCFPYTSESGLPDYSELDLSELQLPNYPSVDELISLNGTILTNVSIGKRQERTVAFSMLTFSEDNAYLAAARGSRVIVYSLQNDEPPMRYRVNGSPSRMEFAGNYLFVVVGDRVFIFMRGDAWHYTGEIFISEERSIFNRRLKKIILTEDSLFFYYNNRIRQFHLPDGVMIVNRQCQHPLENPVAGYDLTCLREKQPKSQDKVAGITCKAEHNGLIATARNDGDLRITSGKELYCILSRGITLLKDGAISGNGKWAATLSHEIFSGSRKVQYWNLDAKVKEKELYCPGEIVHIHLSENGNWLFGETDKRCWVINVDTGNAIWFEEHFISNQHSKLVTYGDWVFRKNDQNIIYLFNLATGEIKDIENRSKNSRIATLMPDGTVASVGNNACKALLKNSKDGHEMQINNDQSVVLGIYGLKKQPFIAIATQDNLISIYHTGTGQRTRKIDTKAGNYIVVLHPEESVIACTDGRRLETWNYYEKQYPDKKLGWWYENPYEAESHPISGTIHDIAFNSANEELVVILSNGEIMYCHEKYCRYHSNMEIITNFNVDAYDFTGCICSEEIGKQLRKNGARV